MRSKLYRLSYLYISERQIVRIEMESPTPTETQTIFLQRKAIVPRKNRFRLIFRLFSNNPCLPLYVIVAFVIVRLKL